MRRQAALAWVVGLVIALLGLAVAGCAPLRGPGAGAADDSVILAVANDGAEELRCTILFGHWVELGVGSIAPGGVVEIAMRRQRGDGALYVPRADGRKMMMENVICGPLSGWWERRADIPLLTLRADPARRFDASCRMETRTRCSGPVPQ